MNRLPVLIALASFTALSGGHSFAVQVRPPTPFHLRIGPAILPVPPDPNARARVAALPSAPPGAWKATWDLDTGRVRMLYGGETAPLPGDLEAAARRFLKENAVLFGLSDGSDLTASVPLDHALGATLRFQQRFHGVRVVPGDVDVSRNAAGRIFMVGSGYRPGLDLDTTPRISNADAQRLALGYETTGRPGNPELIVWAPSRPFRLAWQVDVSVRPDRLDRVIVDARSGRMLSRTNLVVHADPLANVYLGNSVSTPQTTAVPLVGLDASGSLTGKFVTVNKSSGRDAQGNPQGAVDLRSQSGSFQIPTTDPRFDQTMMYFHVNRMHDFFHNSFNYTKREGNLPAYVGVKNPDGSALNNAFYSPQCDCIEFGATDSGLDFALDGDVIGHEFTHSVVNTLNDIGKNSIWTESRALNEALADYFSATVQGEGCMGEYITGKTDGSCGRDLANRRHYPEEVGQAIVSKDGSNVYVFPEEHYTSQIWSAGLWDLRRSLGAALADKIIFNSLPLYPQTASFADARVATETTDQQMGTGAAATIAKVMDNRGLATAEAIAYAQPTQFSPDNQHFVVSGLVSPDGGPFSTTGFLPVFVSGRTYILIGILDGFADAKAFSFVLVDANGQAKQKFNGSLADVQIPDPSGQGMRTVKRFFVSFKVPTGQEGDYTVGFAESTDGTNFNLPVTMPGRVIKDAGPTPAPPKDVISTPQPVPTPTTPVPPVTQQTPADPASIQLQPSTVTAPVGSEVRFAATVVDTQGTMVPGAAVNWSIEGPSDLAAIAPNGILSVRRAGQLNVVASIGAVSARANVTIVAATAPADVTAWQFMPGSERGQILSMSASVGGGFDVIYAAALNGIAVSVNGGPFQDIGGGLPPGAIPSAVAANPANPALVYLATYNAGVFRSQDGGTTWQQYAQDIANALFGFFPAFTSVATDANDEVAVGTSNVGTLVRLGAQQPWLDVSAGLSTAIINSFVLNSAGTALFAGSNSGAYRIRAGAPAWSAIDQGLTTLGFENQNLGLPPTVTQMALNPINEHELVAATPQDGLFLTADEGDRWVQSNIGLTDPSALSAVFDPAVPGRLFAGTVNNGVFVSTDDGKLWRAASAGLPIGTIPALAFDAGNPSRLFAGTFGDGVWTLDLKGKIDSSPTPPAPIPGDVDGDGKVNTADAVLSLQIVVGLLMPTNTQRLAADINGDGKVDIRDVTLILRKSVGL